MNITFDQYVFTISVLTEFGVVIPSSFDIQDQKNGVRATAQKGFLYGDSRRPYPAEIEFELEKTDSNGVHWKCTASMQHLIKGIKVRVDSIPGTSLVEAGGNLVENET